MFTSRTQVFLLVVLVLNYSACAGLGAPSGQRFMIDCGPQPFIQDTEKELFVRYASWWLYQDVLRLQQWILQEDSDVLPYSRLFTMTLSGGSFSFWGIMTCYRKDARSGADCTQCLYKIRSMLVYKTLCKGMPNEAWILNKKCYFRFSTLNLAIDSCPIIPDPPSDLEDS